MLFIMQVPARPPAFLACARDAVHASFDNAERNLHPMIARAALKDIICRLEKVVADSGSTKASIEPRRAARFLTCYLDTLDVIDVITSDAFWKAASRSVMPWRRAM